MGARCPSAWLSWLAASKLEPHHLVLPLEQWCFESEGCCKPKRPRSVQHLRQISLTRRMTSSVPTPCQAPAPPPLHLHVRHARSKAPQFLLTEHHQQVAPNALKGSSSTFQPSKFPKQIPCHYRQLRPSGTVKIGLPDARNAAL